MSNVYDSEHKGCVDQDILNFLDSEKAVSIDIEEIDVNGTVIKSYSYKKEEFHKYNGSKIRLLEDIEKYKGTDNLKKTGDKMKLTKNIDF